MSTARKLYLTCITVLFIGSFASACEWSFLIWIPRSPDADPLYQFSDNGKVGYIDQTGKIVIAPDSRIPEGWAPGEFHNGLLEIGESNGVYIDATGKKVIDKRFYRGWDFSEGLAAAMDKAGGKWGYIDTKGTFAITPRFSSSSGNYVWPFENDMAKIEVAGRYGYIDHSGDFVIHPEFLDGDSFHDGFARVIVEGPCVYSRILAENPCPDFGVVPPEAKSQTDLPACKYTFIDTTGHIISSQRYDYARSFSEGLAPVRLGKLWGYIDKTGATIIAPSFESAAPFSEKLGLVSKDGRFGYVDRTGRLVVAPQFKRAESFSDGRAVVGDDAGEWYIDTTGKPAIDEVFAIASPFFKGVAHVRFQDDAGLGKSQYRGNFAYIDPAGKVIFKYKN
jgi:hypothetical protein